MVKVNALDTSRKQIYTLDGKTLKTTVQMHGAKFADGTPQSLYFLAGHGSYFAGMWIDQGIKIKSPVQ